MFRIVMQKNHARRNEQCRATGSFVLHSKSRDTYSANSKMILPLRLPCAACVTAVLTSLSG
jgi:hypothetical protein